MSKTLSELASENIIDSRDIIERFEELKDEKESLESDVSEVEEAIYEIMSELENSDTPDSNEAWNAEVDATEEKLNALRQDLENAKIALSTWLDENQEEFNALESIVDECSGYGDFEHGETLISEEYFPQYAEDFASDMGAIDRNANWPLNHIDWNAAADDLKTDYTATEIEGTTFYFRA